MNNKLFVNTFRNWIIHFYFGVLCIILIVISLQVGRGDKDFDTTAVDSSKTHVTNDGVSFALTQRNLGEIPRPSTSNLKEGEGRGTDMLGSALPTNWESGVATSVAKRETMIRAPLSCVTSSAAPLTDKFYIEHTPWIVEAKDEIVAPTAGMSQAQVKVSFNFLCVVCCCVFQ